MIFLGDAASDSGNFGFSEAWPLSERQLICEIVDSFTRDPPSCPDSMDIHPFRDIDDQFDIGIVIVVCASRNLTLLSNCAGRD